MTGYGMPPTPDELVAARRIVRRLHRAIGTDRVRDRSGMDMWDSLVEGGRAIAVATAALGMEDPAYARAWEQMMDGDDND